MTRYILNSGGLRNKPEKAKKFFDEILKGMDKNPKVLYCFFAQKRENWEIKFQEHQAAFRNFTRGLEPVFEMAMPHKFSEQVKNADIIYFYGGDDHLLLYWLREYDLPEIFKGKVVAGSSAGSDVLVKSFWPYDWRECVDGLGLVPIKFIPHYKSTERGKDDSRGPVDWEKAYDDLRKYGDTNLPIYALEEGDYQVFEI